MITKEFCDEWDGVGLNVKDMIEHFMDSESMFLKYLYKFFDSADSVVLELTSAAEREDYQQMLFSAHALKGLAGNIGLNGVFLPAKKIVAPATTASAARSSANSRKITTKRRGSPRNTSRHKEVFTCRISSNRDFSSQL